MTGRRSGAARGTRSQRLMVALLELLARGLHHLPESLLHRAAHVAGAGLYLVQRERRALVRANLARVVAHLDATGTGSERARRAARDPDALDRLVRDAFGHYLRTYLELALARWHTPATVSFRFGLDDQAGTESLVTDASRPDSRGFVFVALHFGSIELAGMWLAARSGLPLTVPMETLANAPLQDWVHRGRVASGVRLVPAEGVARTLRAALGRREGVALVADRPLDRPGRPTTLFGASAPLASGPAVLALESGATVLVGAARRTGWGSYAGRVMPLVVPVDGERRVRVRAFMDAQARAFEQLVGEAPEQWWTLFFRIWPDIPARSAVRGGP